MICKYCGKEDADVSLFTVKVDAGGEWEDREAHSECLEPRMLDKFIWEKMNAPLSGGESEALEASSAEPVRNASDAKNPTTKSKGRQKEPDPNRPMLPFYRQEE